MYSIVEKKLDVPINSYWKPIDYTEIPDISASELQGRIDKLWSLEAAADISCFVIYADREHFANVSYFTDYEPRFEETLLFLFKDRKPIIVVGNEGSGFVKKIPYPIDVLLFQPFSLIGQPCETSFDFVKLLKKCSIPASGKIGLMGWKKYLNKVFPDKALITDVPHYIVEGLEEVVGKGRLINSIDLMVDNEYGLRHSATAEEIIRFEAIGTKVSRNVFNCICNLREGVSEIEASAYLDIDGDPINTHPNINFGDKNCSYGLASPTYSTKLCSGDFVGVGYAQRGSLVHKVGVFASSAKELPEDKKDYLEKMVKPYFASVARWFEMMELGRSCGDIWEMVNSWIGLEKFGVGLNPGHLIHTDEWTNSPIFRGSNVKIKSGMVFQCDYTVTFSKPYMTCHVEDGVAIADEELRNRIKSISHECWKRIENRKNFIKNVLNIDLPEEALPMSDLAAVCFPWFKNTSVVLAKSE